MMRVEKIKQTHVGNYFVSTVLLPPFFSLYKDYPFETMVFLETEDDSTSCSQARDKTREVALLRHDKICEILGGNFESNRIEELLKLEEKK